jgi:hypothetical protein
MARIREALTPIDGVMGARAWKRFLDCLSWNELAHTAYFRAPGVSTEIATICASGMAGVDSMAIAASMAGALDDRVKDEQLLNELAFRFSAQHAGDETTSR